MSSFPFSYSFSFYPLPFLFFSISSFILLYVFLPLIIFRFFPFLVFPFLCSSFNLLSNLFRYIPLFSSPLISSFSFLHILLCFSSLTPPSFLPNFHPCLPSIPFSLFCPPFPLLLSSLHSSNPFPYFSPRFFSLSFPPFFLLFYVI